MTDPSIPLVTRRHAVFGGLALAGLGLVGCGSSTTAKTGATTATVAKTDTRLAASGSTTVGPVAADAAEALKAQGYQITVDTQGGSAGGIAQLGQGQVGVALSSKPVGDADRKAYPAVAFTETKIGEDAVGIIVRREVVDGGLTSITKAQLAQLFEGKVANWKEIGGPDLGVFVYDKEPGRGTREVLDKFLYAGAGAPPPPTSDRYAIVGGNEETRTKLLSTPGSVGPLSSAFADGQPKLAVLAVEGVTPTPDHIKDGTYPMARPLFLVTNGPATGTAKVFVDYVLSAAGQALVTKHGYLSLAALASS